MRHLVFEMSYEGIWPLIFGRHAAQVKVIEALKCLKCDQDGFAIICRIKMTDKKVGVEDLARGSRIAHVEPLYSRRDGSVVVFISGGFPPISGGKRPPSTALFSDRPPEFVGVNKMKASLVGEEKELEAFLKYAERTKMTPRVLSLTRLESGSEPIFSALSTRQKQSLLTAYTLGYYDVPKKVSSRELARLLKIDKSTLSEHLRKAERRIINDVLAG